MSIHKELLDEARRRDRYLRYHTAIGQVGQFQPVILFDKAGEPTGNVAILGIDKQGNVLSGTIMTEEEAESFDRVAEIQKLVDLELPKVAEIKAERASRKAASKKGSANGKREVSDQADQSQGSGDGSGAGGESDQSDSEEKHAVLDEAESQVQENDAKPLTAEKPNPFAK